MQPGDFQRFSMHDLPENERPRERLWTYGPQALSPAELLAIILRTGNSEENALTLAERILSHYNGLSGLAKTPVTDLARMYGIGKAKSAQIAAALELGKRLVQQQAIERPIIKKAADAAQLVADMAHLPQEQVRVILLDSSKRVVTIQTVYVGTLNATVLRTSEIFREAVIRNCPALIIVHNHPSGDAQPSPEDVSLTRTLIAAGHLLDIEVLDHLIIGQQGWISLQEMGLGFER